MVASIERVELFWTRDCCPEVVDPVDHWVEEGNVGRRETKWSYYIRFREDHAMIRCNSNCVFPTRGG